MRLSYRLTNTRSINRSDWTPRTSVRWSLHLQQMFWIFIIVCLCLMLGKLKVKIVGKPCSLRCLSNTHFLWRYLQTLIVVFRHSKPIKILKTTTYDNIGTLLEWVSTNQNKQRDKTLMFIMPGLTGCANDNYVSQTIKLFEGKYDDICVYNYALMSSLPKYKRINIMEDIKHVLQDLKQRYAKIDCVGFSYGANQLLYYIGTSGKNCVVNRAAIVSNPFNLNRCSQLLGRLQDKGLTKMLVGKISKQAHNFKNFDLDWQRIKQCQKLKELDQHFTIKVYGFSSTDEYYEKVSSGQFVDGVAIPVLSISSLDDDISQPSAIKYSDKISFLLTDKGGHNAFLDWRLRFWFLEPLGQFMSDARDS